MEVILGVIVKSFGIKGEVKVHSNTDFAKERYKKGNQVSLVSPINNNKITVTINSYKSQKDMDIVSFVGYETPEVVEKFIGYQVIIDKPTKSLKDGLYYYADLFNCEVFYNDKKIGTVIDLFDCGNTKTLRIKRENKKDLLYPFIERFIANVDVENSRIDINPIEGMLD